MTYINKSRLYKIENSLFIISDHLNCDFEILRIFLIGELLIRESSDRRYPEKFLTEIKCA